ncbi:class I SAM-dependent methyltransferase [Patescibacteria group bacterium]
MANESGSQIASKFVDPMDILAHVSLTEGQSVADFGCGPGFFTLPMAELVGKEGHVYAIDVLEDVLNTINSQAKTRGIYNIATSRANIEKIGGSKLKDGSVDLVVIKNVLFQNQDKATILEEASRILKNSGKIMIMEWKSDNLMFGPDAELRIDLDDLRGMLEDKGFIVDESFDAGDFHYVIVASK